MSLSFKSFSSDFLPIKPLVKTAAVSAALLVSVSSFAEQASDKSVKELLQVTGAGDMAVQMMGQMIPAMQQMMPDAPEEIWVEFSKQIDGDELENLVVPVYQKHLTQADVDAQLKFLKSDAGQKMISVQPLIMQESMAIGQQWGMQVMQRAMEQLDNTPAQ